MVHLVCVESGGNLADLKIRLASGKSMMAQLISKKAGNQNG
jgi:chemotaxis receptor (MCP) glutamine deamidase CheD